MVIKVPLLIQGGAKEQLWHVTKEMLKVGMAMVTAQAGFLRGPDVFKLNLAGLHNNIHPGKDEIMPEKRSLGYSQNIVQFDPVIGNS